MGMSLTTGELRGKALKQVRAHSLGPEERAYIVFPNRELQLQPYFELVL